MLYMSNNTSSGLCVMGCGTDFLLHSLTSLPGGEQLNTVSSTAGAFSTDRVVGHVYFGSSPRPGGSSVH